MFGEIYLRFLCCCDDNFGHVFSSFLCVYGLFGCFVLGWFLLLDCFESLLCSDRFDVSFYQGIFPVVRNSR